MRQSKAVLWGLFLIGVLLSKDLLAQSVSAGPICRLPHYEQLIGFTQGGDDHYYLIFSSSGSVGKFSGFGESVVTLRRFDQELQLTHEISIGKGRGVDQVTNVYGMLASKNGIALISIMRTDNGVPSWFLCKPEFDESDAHFDCDSIFPMPGHNPGFTNPSFRIQQNPKGQTAIAWRSIDRPEDNSLRVVILDEDLEVLQEPQAPFLKWREPVDLSYWTLLNDHQIVFQIHGQEGPRRKTDKSGGIGMIFHDYHENHNRLFSLSSGLMLPLSLSGATHPESGRHILAGLYARMDNDSLEIGLYQGEYRGGDTLSNLDTKPFGPEMWNFLVHEDGREKGQFRFRRPFQQMLDFVPAGRNPFGILFHPYLVTDFMGRPDGTFRIKGTSKVARSLYCYDLGPAGKGVPILNQEYQMTQFEEHHNSWGCGFDEGWMTLINCANVKNEIRPYGYDVYGFQVQDQAGNLGIIKHNIANDFADKGRDFTVLRSRFSAGGDSKVVVSRFRNKLRLIRIGG